MKLDSSPSSASTLIGYLVTNLRPLTAADPAILAKHVVALLKKNEPTEELQKLCVENLEDFLGNSTQSFVNKLFEALEDGSIVRPVDGIDAIKKSEPSASPVTVDLSGQTEVPSNSPCKKKMELSSPSGPGTDPEDQEVSDDDDRNHKHRKRDPQSMTSDRDDQRQFFGRSKSRPSKNIENGALSQEWHSHLNKTIKTKREYNTLLERDSSLKFEKRHLGMPILELGRRNRMNQSIQNESAPHLDPSTSLARAPGGRGRGRGTGPWRKQHDSRFIPLGSVDFASRMASQRPSHPNMFVGTNLPSAASTQNASWGAFGFVPGMSSMCLDPLHPLGLQRTLHSSISMPRQHCRDFEEQGFCLMGDMCPKEHGVNRIVVEDVQSLSQFNLPVSLPNTHTSGPQAETGPVNSTTNCKPLPNKSSKVGVPEAGKMNDVLYSSTPGVESDVYDPDQPLWNNDHPESSKGLSRLPPNPDATGPLWHALGNHTFKLPDGIENDKQPSSSEAININHQLKRQISSGAKLKLRIGAKNTDNETKVDNEDTVTGMHGALNHSKASFIEEIDPKVVEISSAERFHKHSRHNTSRTSQQNLRTLFVSRIPQNSNKKSSLLSHFERFGKVIDIYIPLNSEKAFVQFSKREEAETALKAPDAVMGNRFIKLFWANRDNIADEMEVKPVATSVADMPEMISSAPSKPLLYGGREFRSIATTKASNRAVYDAMSSATQPKAASLNTAKAMLTPKKLEALELLKEELRKKQESLAQKRTSFRNQLDKMEKEAVSLQKVEPVSERQPFKKQKSNKDVEAVKTQSLELVDCTTRLQKDCGKIIDERISTNSVDITNSNADPTVQKQLPKCSIQANNPSIPSANRFKLDSQPAGFRIIPPLPDDFSNVMEIREHFSTFGDVSTVELEDPEAKSRSGALKKPSTNCFAHVTFTARHSAEKAFLGGRCWQGQNLQFKWLTAPPNVNPHDSQKISMSNLEGVEVSPESIVPRSSSSSGVSTSIVLSNVVDTMSEPVDIVSNNVDAVGDGC